MNAQTQATLFSSDQTEWETPREFFDVLDREFDFTLDAAASAANARVPTYYTEMIDALSLPNGRWGSDALRAETKMLSIDGGIAAGAIWLNPPYGKGLFKWVERAAEEGALGARVVVLIPSRTDTKYFHLAAARGAVRLLAGRLHFELNGKPIANTNGTSTPAPFPSAIVVFGPRVRPGIRLWDWKKARDAAST